MSDLRTPAELRSDLATMEAAVAKLRRRAAAAESALATARADRVQHDRDCSIEGASKIRALALEEAASKMEEALAVWRSGSSLTYQELAQHFRNVAPLPPSLFAVPRETIEKVKEVMRSMRCHDCGVRLGNPDSSRPCCVTPRAALAALKDLP